RFRSVWVRGAVLGTGALVERLGHLPKGGHRALGRAVPEEILPGLLPRQKGDRLIQAGSGCSGAGGWGPCEPSEIESSRLSRYFCSAGSTNVSPGKAANPSSKGRSVDSLGALGIPLLASALCGGSVLDGWEFDSVCLL